MCLYSTFRRLPSLKAHVRLTPQGGESHLIHTEVIEDEIYVWVDHPMTKAHTISFLAAVSDQGTQIVKLYPEGSAEARFKRSRVKCIYAYCNRHGLFAMRS